MSSSSQKSSGSVAAPARPVRFAVVGCGSLAQQAHLPNLADNPRAVLQVCCDTSEETLAVCRERFSPQATMQDWREAVADPDVDAICLATTEKLRLPVIQACAEAGKAIYVEKPMAQTLAEAEAIQRVVREAGVPCCIGHNRRSSPAMLEAHRLFRSHMATPQSMPWRWVREPEGRPALPEDGAPLMCVRVNDDWWSWKNWVFDKQHAPHGPMLFEMTHFTDLCNWFLDDEPVEVTAMESGMLNHAVIIRYRQGGMATIAMGANGSFGYPKELYEVMGGGAVVAIDHMVEVRTVGIPGVPARKTYPLAKDPYPELGQEGGINAWLAKRARANAEAAEQGDPALQLRVDADKGHAHQLDRFIDEIHGTGPEVCGVDAALQATRVAFAAIRSAAEHRPVKVEEIKHP